MQKEEFIKIAGRVSDGSANDQEKQLFLYHLGVFSAENPVYDEMDSAFKNSAESEVRSAIRLRIMGRTSNRSLWTYTAIAATIAIVMLVWIFHISLKTNLVKSGDFSVNVNDVRPGKNIASLTLPNGKKVELSENKQGILIGDNLKYNDGTPIEADLKTSNLMLTAQTPVGGTYQVILNDGTKVWLNAASILRFPTSFKNKQQRVVELVSGEAYFEVTKDKNRPFIVENIKQKVLVLGTHFNISAYNDEPSTRTTLLEGMVKVIGPTSSDVLMPGQQSVLQEDRLAVQNVDTEAVASWKDGDFHFRNERLEEVMLKLSRWYGLSVVYQEKEIKNIPLFAHFSRNSNLGTILRSIGKTADLDFKINGRQVNVRYK